MAPNFQLLTKPTSGSPSTSTSSPTTSPALSRSSSPSPSPSSFHPSFHSSPQHSQHSTSQITFSILLTLYKLLDTISRRLAYEFALFMLGGGFNLMLVLLWPGWIPILGVVGGCWWVYGWGWIGRREMGKGMICWVGGFWGEGEDWLSRGEWNERFN